MLARHRTQQRRVIPVVAISALSLAACTAATDKLYISSTTLAGLDASVNSARTSGRVQLGYDRYFGTWVPQTVQGENGSKETMSVLNCTHLEVNGLSIRRFEETLATGVAAANFAKALADKNSHQYFECFADEKQEGK